MKPALCEPREEKGVFQVLTGELFPLKSFNFKGIIFKTTQS